MPDTTVTGAPLLPARMLNEFVYCPRLFYLEWVSCEFEESADTLDGSLKHRRVDQEKGTMPSADEATQEKFHAQSILLSGEKCGLIAKIDVIEGTGSKATPVEYKRGKKPDAPEGAWLADRIQLCAQALILRENGYSCLSGVVYYAKSKARVVVEFTDELVKQTRECAKQAKRTAEAAEIPAPLKDSPKCPRCSLAGICLPDETNMLSGRENGVARKIVPTLDESLPVYIQEQGATITKNGDELVIKNKDGVLARTRLIEVSQLSVFGNVQITTQTLRALCDRNIPISYFSYGGWFYAITHGMSHKNIELRLKQFSTAENLDQSLTLARAFTNGKIRNCQNIPQAALVALAKYAEHATRAATTEELLGIEGSAARVYFMHFKEMLKPETDLPTFDFPERNRRPPRDPVNALLSYVYALMTKDFTITLLSTGFDPYLGFYHAPRYGKPALALDLMEEFRPLIGDSVVLTAINNGEVGAHDFIKRAGAVSIKPDSRKKILQIYERRLKTEITHPLFKYAISYRRLIEVQSRLLARYLNGEISKYPSFLTR